MKKIIPLMIILLILINAINLAIVNETIEATNMAKLNFRADCNKIAISFDDGPHSIYTNKLLDGLNARNIKASFFLMGQNIEGNEETVKRMYDEGHLIGNHTYSHIDLEKITFDKACEEIGTTNDIILGITGESPHYIRPPFGSWNELLQKETSMSIVLWNVDPLDWRDQNAQVVSKRILKKVKSGDIILLHDIFESSVDAAFIVIDKLLSEGYEFVTVDKLEENCRIIR